MIDLDAMSIEELRKFELEIQKRRHQLDTEQRRGWQTKELASGGSCISPVGIGLGDFCDDLVFHAKILKRPIEGRFNDFLLKAYPDSSAGDLYRRYIEARK